MSVPRTRVQVDTMRIRRLLYEKNVTNEQLAGVLYYSSYYITNCINNGLMPMAMLENLSRFLGVPAQELLGAGEEPFVSPNRRRTAMAVNSARIRELFKEKRVKRQAVAFSIGFDCGYINHCLWKKQMPYQMVWKLAEYFNVPEDELRA